MAGNDYVKFMTEQVVKYLDQPKDERKRQRQEKKQLKNSKSSHFYIVGSVSFRMPLCFYLSENKALALFRLQIK
ncbi:hypothetical protein JS44_12590 [Anoxybacillus flavithermus]|uniref:YqzE family protein n=1 Tax=Anoxybacillus flavithermus TaxID=33934 RepID=A0A094IX83_9BACL|nr:hypothetical protein JS44_12590 [Anoxybacillus flavithermus]